MSTDARTCLQINRQTHFGGGEVYTRFLCRAFAELGWKTRLVVAPEAAFWRDMDLPATELVPVADEAAARAFLDAAPPALVLTHGPVAAALRDAAAARHTLWGIAHMPLYGRNPEGFRGYHRVFGVSDYVRRSLADAGLGPIHPEPLYGVADLAPRPSRAPATDAVVAHSRYDWDTRKGRDRLLSWIEPWWRPLLPARRFTRAPGITLGIVSRITPIKQFPLLFAHLAPVLAHHPDFHLEVFGAGGYASVRDLDRALAPVADRVRFWGQQSDVRRVYGEIDYLLTGLPEKEALGLNILEAEACGVPVLAPRGGPFPETVADGVTGRLYADPRDDGGADFDRLLESLAREPFAVDRDQAAIQLARFSFEAFVDRLGRALAGLPETGALR